MEAINVFWILSAGTLIAALVLIPLLLVNLRMSRLGYWPAEAPAKRVLMLGLFRSYCLLMVATAAVALWAFGLGAWPRYAIGLPVMVGAYAASLWAYKRLGKENTYFSAGGLVTGGIYAYSRNPGYVASLAAAFGLAVIAGSWVVLAQAAGLFAIYFLFALNEERWLRAGYGMSFLRYMTRTPRFLGLRSLARARDDLAARL